MRRDMPRRVDLWSGTASIVYWLLAALALHRWEARTIGWDPRVWSGLLSIRVPLVLGLGGLLVGWLSPREGREDPAWPRLAFADLLSLLVLLMSLHLAGRAGPAAGLWLSAAYLALFAARSWSVLRALLIGLVRHPASRHALRIFLAAFWFHAALLAYVERGIDTHGDEPHYLIMTHSLMQDGDLNQRNNYDAEDYRRFHRHVLQPKMAALVSDESIYSRGFGGLIPLLLVPGYALAGRLGAAGTIVLASALLASLSHGLYRRIGGSPRAAAIGLLTVMIAPPLLIHSSLCYPDIPAGALVLLGLHVLSRRDRLSSRGFLGLLGIVLLMGGMKLRFLPLGAGLLALAWPRLPRGKRGRMLLVPVGLGLLVATDAFLLRGTLLWSRFPDLKAALFTAVHWHRLLLLPGLLLDQESGLLLHAPVWIVALTALAHPPLRRGSRLSWLALPYLLIFLLHPLWHGLPTPPLRYLVPVLPLAGTLLVRGWDRGGQRFRGVAVLALGWSIAAGALLHLWSPFRYNMADGSQVVLESAGRSLQLNLVRLLPSMIVPTSFTAHWLLLLVAVALAILWVRRSRTAPPPREEPPGDLPLTRTGAWPTALSAGLLLGLIGTAATLPLRTAQMEDRSLILHSGGVPYPFPEDPHYFPQTFHRGWRFHPRTRVKVPLDLDPTRGELWITLWREGTGPPPILRIGSARLAVPWREPTTVPVRLGAGNRRREIWLRRSASSLHSSILVDRLVAPRGRPRTATVAHAGASLLAAGWPEAALQLSRLAVDLEGSRPANRLTPRVLLWLDLCRSHGDPARMLHRARRLEIPLPRVLDDPELLMALAREALRQSAAAEVEDLAQRAADLGAREWETALIRGLAAMEACDFDRAFPLLQAAAERPGSTLPAPDLSHPGALAGHLPEAWRDILRRAPQQEEYHDAAIRRARTELILGREALEGGDADEAARRFESALRAQPGWTAERLPWARPEARPLLRNLDAGIGLGPLHLGIQLARFGELVAAQKRLEWAARQWETSFEAHFHLAELYRRQGNWSAALVEIERALEIQPQDPEARALHRGLRRRLDGRKRTGGWLGRARGPARGEDAP